MKDLLKTDPPVNDPHVNTSAVSEEFSVVENKPSKYERGSRGGGRGPEATNIMDPSRILKGSKSDIKAKTGTLTILPPLVTLLLEKPHHPGGATRIHLWREMMVSEVRALFPIFNISRNDRTKT
jgi:hypothetical protein